MILYSAKNRKIALILSDFLDYGQYQSNLADKNWVSLP
jgi:hypothetical protein